MLLKGTFSYHKIFLVAEGSANGEYSSPQKQTIFSELRSSISTQIAKIFFVLNIAHCVVK